MCAFYSTKVAIKWETDVRYGQIFGIGRHKTSRIKKKCVHLWAYLCTQVDDIKYIYTPIHQTQPYSL